MKIVFICASVDINNAIVGDTLDRALAIAGHSKVSSLSIVSLHGVGEWSVSGLKVRGVGSDRLGTWAKLIQFFKVISLVVFTEKPDVFYLYMCPTLAPFLWPFKIIYNIKVVQWFGHAIYTKPTKIALKYFSDLWFNSNKSMAPFPVKHLRLVGQGVKPDQFFYDPSIEKKYDIVTVGRITPVKKIHQMLEILKICRDQYGKLYSLNICGDAFVKDDIEYKNSIEKLVKEFSLEKQVFFSGMVSRSEISRHIQQAKVFLFLVPGGIGKAPLEGIACGLPVVISSPHAVDFFGEELSPWFLCERDSNSIAQALVKILEADLGTYRDLCEKAHQLFMTKYTMEKFIDRIVNHIQAAFFEKKVIGVRLNK